MFFVDEVHALKKIVDEYLYSAMEDFRIDIVIDSGPPARTVRLVAQALHARRRDDARRHAL